MTLLLSSSVEYPSHVGILQNCLRAEYGAFNLADTINSSYIDNATSEGIIWIRRIENDQLFPYDAGYFTKWYHLNQTDPVTREDLRHVGQYVHLKELEMQVNCAVKLRGITKAFKTELLQQLLRGRIQSFDDNILARCHIDLNILIRNNMVHSMTFYECQNFMKERPEKMACLLRRSCATNGMPNSEVVVLSIKTPKRIYQYRFLHVMGVGWYKYARGIPGTFKEIIAERPDTRMPHDASLVGIVETTLNEYVMTWGNLIPCQ